MNNITIKAFGKINLGLDVLGKMPDGYHNLRMIMQTVGIYDTVEIERSKTGDGRKNGTENEGSLINVYTNVDSLPGDEHNLAYKAAKLLMDEFGIEQEINIKIDKVIPIAGGMAGGSADCAAVLKGVNILFSLGLSDEELMERGVKLGADVPYCVMGGTALAEGIGEKLTELPDVPQAHVVIAKPGISVSTKYVYEAIDSIEIEDHPDTDAIIAAIEAGDLYDMAGRLRNVLEDVTVNKYPIINTIKKAMMESGAIGAMMSGSGPTVFGIFDSMEGAKKAVQIIERRELAAQLFLTEFHNHII